MKRLANHNRVKSLFQMVDESDMLRFYRTEYTLRAQRTVRSEEDKTSFSLGRSAEGFVVSLLSNQLAQLEETVNAS